MVGALFILLVRSITINLVLTQVQTSVQLVQPFPVHALLLTLFLFTIVRLLIAYNIFKHTSQRFNK